MNRSRGISAFANRNCVLLVRGGVWRSANANAADTTLASLTGALDLELTIVPVIGTRDSTPEINRTFLTSP